jgi:hypothetical protein
MTQPDSHRLGRVNRMAMLKSSWQNKNGGKKTSNEIDMISLPEMQCKRA